jgi:uncharacterized ferritin-like protein (DUF455 family)
MNDDLFTQAQACIAADSADAKVARTQATARAWREGAYSLVTPDEPLPIGEPGRPALPQLVHPRDVPRRRATTPEGRAILIHAIAHIEFNAIDLAWDAVYRFRGMPRDYYDDWVRVADEEAQHFALLRGRLHDFGCDYGAYAAHHGLWEMAQKTADDVLVRMALVPRVLEARGLDVTPGILEKLRVAGDDRSAAILEIILRDEIGHVTIGTRWFRYLCAERNLDPDSTFEMLMRRYIGEMNGRIQGPFHEAARAQAGFSDEEMAKLRSLDMK